MAFKIALTAGHYKYTSGKRCLKSLDPNETREWVLNDRIADLIEKGLQAYTGWELLRTDDTTGEKKIELDERTDAANAFGADFYLSIHHNAGIKGGKGGGIVAYIYTSASKEAEAWQRELYNALIAATGLKGNRSEPLKKANLHEVREPKAPAVLLELGFMDSATDVPIILSAAYAQKCADAIVGVLVKRGGLKKKTAAPTTGGSSGTTNTNKEEKPANSVLYYVQSGAYSNKANADTQAAKIKAAGFDVLVKKVGNLYKVQTGAYSKKSNADAQAAKMKAKGFDAYVTTNGGTTASSTSKSDAVSFKVGDKVKCNAGVTKFSNGKKMSSWVPTSVLYVRAIENNGKILLVSTEPKKGVYTGRVNASDVHKI